MHAHHWLVAAGGVVVEAEHGRVEWAAAFYAEAVVRCPGEVVVIVFLSAGPVFGLRLGDDCGSAVRGNAIDSSSVHSVLLRTF